MYAATYWVQTTLLKNRQSCNLMVRFDTENGGTDTAHVIGSKFSETRGRFILLTRATTTVYACRMSDDGMVFNLVEQDSNSITYPGS